MENRYKAVRENYEFENGGTKMTAKELADIFTKRGYDTLTHSAIRKIETNKREVSIHELKGYCEVFNTTSDYLLGIRDTKPVDENIAMIGKVTGLNDTSIECLKCLSSNDTEIHALSILNTLMRNKEIFTALLGNIGIMFGIYEWDSVIAFNSSENNNIVQYYQFPDGAYPAFARKNNQGEYDGILAIDSQSMESIAFLAIRDLIQKYKDSQKGGIE